MFPLSDPDIVRRATPVLTIGFIAVNVLVFLYQLSLDEVSKFVFAYRFGVIPAEVLGGMNLESIPVRVGFTFYRADVATPIPTWGTILTSMFMHGGFMHLAGNMLYLWVFGNTLEGRMNHLVFGVFYLAAGVAAVFAQAAVGPDSMIPMVGASGAVSGILGAYLVLYPLSRINTLVVFGLVTSIRVPAYIFLGIWLLLQLFNSLGSLGPEVANTGGVAYFAHIGGFVVGLAVGALYRFAGGNDAAKPRGGTNYCAHCGGGNVENLYLPRQRYTRRYCGDCGRISS